jgi:hypothetical protein
MTTSKRRLDKLEGALSPTEAVLRWLAEAHEHPTLPEYVQSLLGQPNAAYPLYRLPEEMEISVRQGLKGQPREQIERAVRVAVRDAAFLVYLVTQTNHAVLAERRANSLHFLLVSQGLKALLRGHEPWEGEAQQRWSTLAESLVLETFTVHGAIERIATTYFRGRSPLFPDTAADLQQLVTATEGIMESVERCLARGLLESRGNPKRKRRLHEEEPPLDLPAVREAALESAATRAAQIVSLAQGDALLLIGERERAFALVEGQVR